MQPLEIKICGVNDPPPFPELKDTCEAEAVGFVILEKGTGSGKTSCAIVALCVPDREPVIIQFSADMFLTLAAALKGARERFGDPWKGV